MYSFVALSHLCRVFYTTLDPEPKADPVHGPSYVKQQHSKYESTFSSVNDSHPLLPPAVSYKPTGGSKMKWFWRANCSCRYYLIIHIYFLIRNHVSIRTLHMKSYRICFAPFWIETTTKTVKWHLFSVLSDLTDTLRVLPTCRYIKCHALLFLKWFLPQ